MYLNTISYNYAKVSSFLTSEECFTPHNPLYKKVQKVLEEIGWDPECNHVFRGDFGPLQFTHSEVRVYHTIYQQEEQRRHNRKNMKSEAKDLISNLEYIFLQEISPESVEKILKS